MENRLLLTTIISNETMILQRGFYSQKKILV